MQRREWSKAHGGDDYDKTGSGFAQDVSDKVRNRKQQCKCGSNTHSRPNNKNCPLNKSKALDESDRKEKPLLEIDFSSGDEDNVFSDAQQDFFFEDEEFYNGDFEQCICGAEGRSHKRYCPLNPHALFQNDRCNKGKPTHSHHLEKQPLDSRVLFSNDQKGESPTYCTCQGKETNDMVACDGPNCLVEWFHYKCVGLDKAPESEMVL